MKLKVQKRIRPRCPACDSKQTYVTQEQKIRCRACGYRNDKET